MTAVRIEAMDPRDERALQAMTSFLTEMVEKVDASVLGVDIAAEAEEHADTGIFLAALDDRDRVVGCGMLVHLEPGVGEIRRMWVNPILRGKGIGRRLLSALEGAGAVAGFEVIRLEAYDDLTEAVLLFETSGYQRVDPPAESPTDLRAYEKRLVVSA